MFKIFFKRMIMFFIPFLFINNIYASENLMINYRYKTSDGDYIVTMEVDSEFYYRENITVSKYSSSSTGSDKPFEIEKLTDFFGTDQILSSYGLTDGVGAFAQYNYTFEKEGKDFFTELKNNPEKYRPILKFDNEGRVILIGSYFLSEAFEETEESSFNLNDYSNEFVEKFLHGELSDLQIYKLRYENFYTKLNINADINPIFAGVNVDSVNLEEESYNANFTAGTCLGYYKGLKEMREIITGKTVNGKKISGICSAKSLNAMQNVSSLYDLENNFDNSILEPECRNMIFSENGYIRRVLQAQNFYNNLIFENEKKAYMISCLSMETEYLKGFGLLTVYAPVIDKSDETGCELIGSEIIDFINDIFDAVKIICTVVCILLCIIDVYKMIVAKGSDIAKFKTVLVKRVIALVAVFLLPLFINIVTDLINDRYLKSNPSKCSNIIRK